MRLVATQGALNWVRISQQLGTRTPKQCRERYHQNLKPNLNHEPISQEEGLVIEQLVREIGKRWAEIARRLNNRSDNAVKNWWNGNQNRRKRMDRRKTTIPLQAARYEDRGEMSPLGTTRLTMSVPRTIVHGNTGTRHLPPPIASVGVYDRNYGVETPLPSPSLHSPDTASDASSHYATSPGRYSMASPVARLPPLLHTQTYPTYQPLPRSLVSPMETKLPPINAMNFFTKQESSYPSMAPHPAEYPSPRLTAPNSPAGYAEQYQMTTYGGEHTAEKDSRISVANLLA